MSEIKLTDCEHVITASDANLSESEFSDARLVMSVFKEVSFEGSTFLDVHMDASTFSNASFVVLRSKTATMRHDFGGL